MLTKRFSGSGNTGREVRWADALSVGCSRCLRQAVRTRVAHHEQRSLVLMSGGLMFHCYRTRRHNTFRTTVARHRTGRGGSHSGHRQQQSQLPCALHIAILSELRLGIRQAPCQTAEHLNSNKYRIRSIADVWPKTTTDARQRPIRLTSLPPKRLVGISKAQHGLTKRRSSGDAPSRPSTILRFNSSRLPTPPLRGASTGIRSNWPERAIPHPSVHRQDSRTKRRRSRSVACCLHSAPWNWFRIPSKNPPQAAPLSP
jgi:hypothetical protein